MTDIFPGATLVQLIEWGYPMGSLRPTPSPDLAYSVIHITANLASAENEVAWRRDDPGLQNSATFFVNQDGSVVQALGDPLNMDPWTNGIFANPDLSNLRIAAARAAGVNPNERSLITIENVGREPGAPITAAQEATNAAILRYYHAKAGLAINRQTVLGHYQFDSVNRPNCPATDKSVIDRIIALATEEEAMAPAPRPVSASIGTFAWTGTGHMLLSPIDTVNIRFKQSDHPGPFSVAAAIDLRNGLSGVPVDIDGREPPVNNRDQVYLVMGPGFAAGAYVLRADGVFTPDATYTQSELDDAVSAAQAAGSAEGATAVAEAAVAKAEEF